MKYPCENCIVDVVCIKACDNMLFFIDSLIGVVGEYVPEEWILTEHRVNRIIASGHLYKSTYHTSLFVKIINQYKSLKRRKHGVSV